jgi:hypothetical protein
MKVGKDTLPPRGALGVVAVGLLATVAAALLSTNKPIGSAVLEWEAKAPMPDSKHVAIPGGGGMQLSDAGIRATEANGSGYRLFRVASLLTIDRGSAVGSGRLHCIARAPGRQAELARTPNSRAAYPRSSSESDLMKQGEVPKEVDVALNVHGAEFAAVQLGDAFPAYTSIRGIVVNWAPYQVGKQEWRWALPKGRPAKPIELGFASIWRTSRIPELDVSCVAETSKGSAEVSTTGALKGLEKPS